jgi:hypothetical protein
LSESDLGRASEILLNNFKTFFIKEFSNILAWRLAKSVQETINQNLLSNSNQLELNEFRLNTTLTADPLFFSNALALPVDGSVIGATWNELGNLPAFIESANEPLI